MVAGLMGRTMMVSRLNMTDTRHSLLTKYCCHVLNRFKIMYFIQYHSYYLIKPFLTDFLHSEVHTSVNCN